MTPTHNAAQLHRFSFLSALAFPPTLAQGPKSLADEFAQLHQSLYNTSILRVRARYLEIQPEDAISFHSIQFVSDSIRQLPKPSPEVLHHTFNLFERAVVLIQAHCHSARHAEPHVFRWVLTYTPSQNLLNATWRSLRFTAYPSR